jgi:membrane protein implicated in regulation of membrane protease activity
MTTFQRYLLFQIPGWILGAIILFVFREWIGLPLWGSVLLYSLYVGKDFVLYPFLSVAYRADARTGAEQLIGEIATVKTRLDPYGYVRVRGELWKARLMPGSVPVVENAVRVRVQAVRRMTLIVRLEEDEQ